MIKSYLTAIVAAILSLFGNNAALPQPAVQAASANAAVSSQVEPISATTSPQQEAATAFANGQAASFPAVLYQSTPTPDLSGYVTQQELNSRLASLSALSASLQLLIAEYQFNATPQLNAVSQNVAADGNPNIPFAAGERINNLSGVTISNATIDSSSIPNLSGSYLSLNGGTLSGALGIGTTTPQTALSVNGAISATDAGSSSVAVLGAERATDGSFTTDPSSSWTLGSGWSWDSGNHRASYTGTGGPISSIAIDDGGTGYTTGDTITISGGSGDATYTATANSSGKITALSKISGGTSYSTATVQSTTGGTGTGLKVSIKQITDASALSQMITTNSSDPTTSYISLLDNSTISGTTYQVSFAIAGYSGSGQVQVDLGSASAHTYNSTYYKSNGTYTVLFTTSNPILTFIPTGDFVGEISNVSVKPVTQTAAAIKIQNTDGSGALEIRPGGISNANTYIGLEAGQNTTSGTSEGSQNTGVGKGVLFSNISGSWNVAMGDNALFSNTTGSGNVGVGFFSLWSNTSACCNTAVGKLALYSNTTGGSNTAYGFQSMFSNTTASNNTAVGYESLFSNTTGGSNTAVGYFAMLSNRTGSNNTALGLDSLFSNTTGSNNVSLGYLSLFNNTTGANNTAGGQSALTANTTGGNNTAFGFSSMVANLSGTSNTGIGNNALRNATTSSNNTAVGSGALQGGTTGAFTIAGTNNAALGLNALQNYIDGSSNVAFGATAMQNSTTSKNNVAVGFASGKGSSTNDNFQGLAALGYQTGLALQNGADYNTLLGYGAGNLLTTGNHNILIGAASTLANSNLTTGSGNIIIGYNISATSSTATNSLDIGNLLFGTGLDGSGTSLSSGSIGIGTTTPWRKFSVNGTIGFAGLTTDSADNAALCLTSSNEVVVHTGASTCITSSQRFKNTIAPLGEDSGLAEVLKLNPVSFQYNQDIGISGTQIGFIAEQMQQVDPRLNELCVGSTCVTEAQFQAMVAAANVAQSSQQQAIGAFNANATSTTDGPPVIQINGNNPATLHVGDTYADLGATITGPQGDLNLGIKTFLNGALVSNIVIDTSAVATDTIDYAVTDQNGLTSTSSRTVIVAAPESVETSLVESPSASEAESEAGSSDSIGTWIAAEAGASTTEATAASASTTLH